MNNNTLTPELLEKMDAYWLAVMSVLNDLARFHLMMDTIDSLPQIGKPV
jgi:phosphoketolase